MVPGVSRSASTIFGGVFSGFNRQQAAEFSFLLAIPTMFAASGYDLLKEKDNIHSNDITILCFGGLIAFIVAFFAVKAFVTFLNKYGFKHFGYYRINPFARHKISGYFSADGYGIRKLSGR